MTGSLVVFCITYLVIATRQLHWIGLDRPAGALVGAVAMVVVGGLPMDAAIAAIKLDVVILLFGVILISAYLQEARLFQLATYLVLTRARSPHSLVFALAGNLTLFGSVANIIVMESAGPRGEIGFWRFFRYGSIVTLVDLALAFTMLYAERWIGVARWLGL